MLVSDIYGYRIIEHIVVYLAKVLASTPLWVIFLLGITRELEFSLIIYLLLSIIAARFFLGTFSAIGGKGDFFLMLKSHIIKPCIYIAFLILIYVSTYYILYMGETSDYLIYISALLLLGLSAVLNMGIRKRKEFYRVRLEGSSIINIIVMINWLALIFTPLSLAYVVIGLAFIYSYYLFWDLTQDDINKIGM